MRKENYSDYQVKLRIIKMVVNKTICACVGYMALTFETYFITEESVNFGMKFVFIRTERAHEEHLIKCLFMLVLNGRGLT